MKWQNWQEISKLTTEADTPLLRWSVLAIVLILVWFMFIAPLQSWQADLGEQIQQNAQQAVRMNSLKNNAESWEQAEDLAVTSFEEAMQTLFLQTSDTAAQAVIQGLLRDQCKALGITIESQRLLEAEDFPGVGRKLSVAMSLRGDLADILTLLDIISGANHILQVDRWFIRKDRDESVVVQIEVAGFRGETVQVADDV